MVLNYPLELFRFPVPHLAEGTQGSLAAVNELLMSSLILIIFIKHTPAVQTGGIWVFLKQVIEISGVLFPPCHALVVFYFISGRLMNMWCHFCSCRWSLSGRWIFTFQLLKLKYCCLQSFSCSILLEAQVNQTWKRALTWLQLDLNTNQQFHSSISVVFSSF